MDRVAYNNLIEAKKYKEAHQYRIIHAPVELYKYMSFSDYDDDINEIKMKALLCNQIKPANSWMTRLSLKVFFVTIPHTPWENSISSNLQELLDTINNNKLICSFTETSQNHMPMWAHYANNHNGLCVKYKVLAWPYPIYLYPVIYSLQKKEILNLEVIDLIFKLQDFGNTNEYSSKLNELNQIINHFPIIKHDSWSYGLARRNVHSFEVRKKYDKITSKECKKWEKKTTVQSKSS